MEFLASLRAELLTAFVRRLSTADADARVRATRQADTMGQMSSEQGWIRKRERPPRPTGPSTVDGKTASELLAQHDESLRNMTADELATYMTAAADQARAGRAEAEEAAAWRRTWRHRMN